MKKICTFLLTVSIVLLACQSYAQVPQKINYQAVARNSSGALLASTNIAVRISIHDGSATGTTVYQERHTATTNTLGLFSFGINDSKYSLSKEKNDNSPKQVFLLTAQTS